MRAATDIGGTFTDLVAIDDQGTLVLEKAHTTPPNFEQGVMEVMEKSGIDLKSITEFFHGTTTIINALTERKGAKTGLITTRGFRDILELDRTCSTWFLRNRSLSFRVISGEKSRSVWHTTVKSSFL